MKKHILFAVFITMILSLTSCADFLQEDLKGEYSSSTYYKTPEQAEFAINAAYNVLLSNNSGNRLWVFADVASDDTNSGNVGDNPDIDNIDKFNINPANGVLEPMWALFYEGITRCNEVLEHVPNITMDDEQKKYILGQAYFLRAYYYFNLANIFGDIPLVLKPLSITELNQPKTAYMDILKQVKIDCNSAVERLPATTAPANLGRASKGAAYALLTKACLYRKEWPQAIEAGLEVSKLGYELTANYKNNFDLAFENSKESIFEVQHQALTGYPTNNLYGQWFAPKTVGGYSFNVPTQELVDQFETSTDGVYVDPRLEATVVKEGDLWPVKDGDGWKDLTFQADWTLTGYCSKKFQVDFSSIRQTSESGPRLINESDLNTPLLRYADVVLMLAEAYNEDNQIDLAAEYLNKVRDRARKSHLDYDNLPADFMPLLSIPSALSQDEMRDRIRHERRVELATEFQRYFDIIRYGAEYANEVFKDDPAFNYSTHKFFPIPQKEIDINPNLK